MCFERQEKFPPFLADIPSAVIEPTMGCLPILCKRRSRLYVLFIVLFLCRKIALVIILTRAGLDLDPIALKRLKVTVPKLGLIPWVVEATVIAVMTKYLLDLPWVWGFLLGSVIAAVSPAVVVPCLFRLRSKGYGVAKVRPLILVPLLEYLNIHPSRDLSVFHS